MLRAPGHDWTLDASAAEAHVSRASLVRIFRKTVGVAPLAFLTDLRLGLARQRLASTEVSVARVAAEVGYQPESAFARAFHRRFNTTPGRIRVSLFT
jgi:AraC family transcriptional activator of mtrCDE